MQKIIKGTGLTRKQKAFADHLINNPKDNAKQAAQIAYKANDHSARVIASQNLARPAIQVYLEEHIDKAKHRVVQLIQSDKEDIALRAADSVLDRALGKATQRTEVTSVSLSFGMDLSGHTEPPLTGAAHPSLNKE